MNSHIKNKARTHCHHQAIVVLAVRREDLLFNNRMIHAYNLSTCPWLYFSLTALAAAIRGRPRQVAAFGQPDSNGRAPFNIVIMQRC